MRKILFAIVFLTLTSIASAQIYKGQYMVGGNASFSSSKYADIEGSVTNIEFNPNFGYFFINNLAGGLRLGLSSFKEEDEDAFTTFSASPFLRYYFLPAAQKVNLFADASYGFGSIGSDDKESFNQYSIMAGPAIFLTPNTALEFGVHFTSQGGDAVGDNRYNTFGLNIGFQIHLGGASRSTAK